MSTVTVPVAPVTGSVTVHVTLPGTSKVVDGVPAAVFGRDVEVADEGAAGAAAVDMDP